MGWKIVKNPEGKFNVFSDIVDDFVAEGLTEDEVVNFYRDRYIARAEEKTDRVRVALECIGEGEHPYSELIKDYDRALSLIKANA